MARPLVELEPVVTLLARVRGELSADFSPNARVRLSRAPGRLDVMGGIADYTGSLVCELPLACAAAVASAERADRQLHLVSLNLHDENKPFALRIPFDGIAKSSADALRREFDEPGRKWAAYLAGCLFVLHEQALVNLSDPSLPGLTLALLSTVPIGAGVSSSAAVEVATMMNLVDHFDLRHIGPIRMAELCQRAEQLIAGAPCGVMDQMTSCCGVEGKLFHMTCQPHEVHAPLDIPAGVQLIGIDSGVKHEVAGSAYARTRCAAFMAHAIILSMMREMGRAAGRELIADPTRGYLANLDPDDYKRFFRTGLPEWMRGRAFIERYGDTADVVTRVDPAMDYPVQHAADHHVLEGRRIRNFVNLLEQANAAPEVASARGALRRAGRLMYASHQSYGADAMLGAPECDLLVELVRQHESSGLWGAKITGGGSGGTVAVMAEASERADAAISQIIDQYDRQSGRRVLQLSGSSFGAWEAGTVLA